MSAISMHIYRLRFPRLLRRRKSRTVAGVVTFACPDLEFSVPTGQRDLAKASLGLRAIRRVADAVLASQLFFNLGVDLIERLLLRILVVRASGLVRNFPQ